MAGIVPGVALVGARRAFDGVQTVVAHVHARIAEARRRSVMPPDARIVAGRPLPPQQILMDEETDGGRCRREKEEGASEPDPLPTHGHLYRLHFSILHWFDEWICNEPSYTLLILVYRTCYSGPKL